MNIARAHLVALKFCSNFVSILLWACAVGIFHILFQFCFTLGEDRLSVRAEATARFSPSWGEKKRGRGKREAHNHKINGLIDISIRPLITIFRTIKGKAEFMTGV